MSTPLVTLWRTLFGSDRTPNDPSARATPYSPAEVRGYMCAADTSYRAQRAMLAVRRLLAQLDDGTRRQFRGSDRIYRKLPLIVLRYSAGRTPDEIAAELGPFVYADDIIAGLDFVADRAARRLNRGDV